MDTAGALREPDRAGERQLSTQRPLWHPSRSQARLRSQPRALLLLAGTGDGPSATRIRNSRLEFGRWATQMTGFTVC
eukprot:2529687-Pyramimonas_sp.AAC.1